jgi:hypothetical protein
MSDKRSAKERAKPHRQPRAPITRGIVHSAGRGHERFAGEIPHHQVQALDANGTSALVGRVVVGIGNLRPMVRPAFVSKMNSTDVSKITLEASKR